MPPPFPSHAPAIVAAVAGAVAGAAALTWGVLRWHRRQQGHEGTGTPTGTWTVQQVAAWLRENGVSKTSVAVCCRYKVDGDTLMRLTAHDLYYMGVPLRDARVILAAVEDVKGSLVLLSSASPRSVSRRQSSVSPRTAQVTVPSAAEQFEAAWRALMRTCALPASGTSPAEQQQRLAVYTGTLLESFQVLTASEQAAALSLVAEAEKVRVAPPAIVPLEAQPGQADTEAPVDTSFPVQAVEEKLRPLHDMLDGFLDFLRSPDLDAVAAAEFDELGERVAAQVKRILRVAEQLPPKLGDPLRRKCDGVFEVLFSRQRTALGASGGEAAGKAKLMQALRSVLSTVEDPQLRELPAAQRVQALSSLAKRAEAIEAVAAGSVSGVPKDVEVLSMVQSLLRIIQEAIRLSEREAEADEDEKEGQAPAAEDADAANGPIPVIVRTVQDIQGTLQSETFQHAPSAVKVELCTTLLQRVAALEDNLAEVPSPAQAMVRDLLSNTRNVLAVVIAAAETEGNDGGEDPPADDEKPEKEQVGNGDAEAAQTEGEKRETQSSDTNIDAYVAQLEKIFDFLTSDALDQATMEERKKVAVRLRQRVEAIKADVAARDPQCTLITELIAPLQNLLSEMASNHVASREFLEITAPLSDVRRLLTSESFQQLPHAGKIRIARNIVPQLQQLTSSFSSLSNSERTAAEELLRPINEVLLHLMRPRGVATGSAQEVLDRLQAVMRTIQGAELTTMSPTERSAWAANTVADLGRLRDDCAALGAEGEALLPIIERLRSQLSGLLPDHTNAGGGEDHDDSGDAERSGAGCNGEAQREQEEGRTHLVWAAPRDMHAELLEAERAATPVPPERLQRMLQMMGEATELPGMSTRQEAEPRQFGSLLRRHAEGVGGEVNDDSTSARVDGAEQDFDEATAALHALRRSLQVLMDAVQDENAATATELSVVASKTEELLASADAAKINWRADSWCTGTVRSISEALQQLRGSGGGASRAKVPSKVEEVLQSSIAALIANPPTGMEDFEPYLRLLQLAQPSAEQMTNRELMLLKSLQESVIEAMRRLPDHPRQNGERTRHETDDEGEGSAQAVLGVPQQMPYKRREGSSSAEELDDSDNAQQDLERLLAGEGVTVEDAIEALREQICLQPDALDRGEAGDEDEVERAGNEEDDACVSQSEAQRADKQTPDPLQPESADAFNEDDDDGVGSSGAAAISGPSSGSARHIAYDDEFDGEDKTHSSTSAA
ncbi:SAM domain (Sterile alpha motif), putative [Leishmania donovani]|uniref:SAM domain (Sterile alpha motif), putative n=1 Tax=Leishmania donovani TaxID=5661 RepID=A0A3Q8IBP4_LEIDO|nr:SAM domain (Sterile alpha motif), putative [Leishmania donovani]